MGGKELPVCSRNAWQGDLLYGQAGGLRSRACFVCMEKVVVDGGYGKWLEVGFEKRGLANTRTCKGMRSSIMITRRCYVYSYP